MIIILHMYIIKIQITTTTLELFFGGGGEKRATVIASVLELGSTSYYLLCIVLDILFSSNHNIHKSSFGLCFWASDPLIDRFL